MNNTDILYKRILIWFMVGVIVPVIFWNFKRGDIVSYMDIAGVAGYYVSNFFIIYYGIKLARALPGSVPIIPILSATFLVVSASIADMGATVICSPTLDREGNILLLMLLSENFSLNSIYLLTILINVIDIALPLILFSCFLKNYPYLIEVIPYSHILTTFKWLVGSGKMKGWKEMVFSSKTDFAFLVSFITFLWVMQSFYRYYMALMWFDKVPDLYTSALLGLLLASTLGFTCFMHYKVKQRHFAQIAQVPQEVLVA